ncbi:hypothetical protein [Sediminibacterium sp. TEGAF015]|uniref:hypothetical protein n=1 Tax=Sediminibacterium sp. TEGAF015 TaxID=575378 RepID=UPI0022060296|nr:hypothetical protein [Sediminibacterium sp. TEGAF015]BDQ12848.1 hypothetical protein TEGAF0_20650 [Sediminibacterium sp. TEGAF015]
MKKLLVLALAAIFTVGVHAQEASWKQMEDFHSVMSKTFHPAEEGNLKPLKENITTLVAKAKAWESGAVPSGYDAKVAKPILKQLVAKCTAVEAAIKAKKSDKELTTLITATHDVFHELKEKCKPGEKH